MSGLSIHVDHEVHSPIQSPAVNNEGDVWPKTGEMSPNGNSPKLLDARLITILENETSTLRFLKRIFIFAGFLFAFLVLCLVAGWASKSGTKYPFYLSPPDWKTALFEWHPILMTAGFFVAQVYALQIMNLLKGSPIATPLHLFCHLIATASLISGLVAIVEYKNSTPGEIHLPSLHTWIGVLATTLYLTNFIGGMVGKAPIMHFAPDRRLHPTAESIIANVRVYRTLHVLTGLSAICASMGAIVSGIVQWSTETEEDMKIWTADDAQILNWATNPVKLYGFLQPGAKLVNGLAIVVIITTLLVLLSTILSLITESIHAFVSSITPKSSHTVPRSGLPSNL